MKINYLDLISTILSLIGTYYFTRANIAMWPLYILATILNTFLYFKYELYASVGLEVLYLSMSVYGWVLWSGKKKERISITKINQKEYFFYIPSWISILILIFILYTKYCSSPLPKLESFAVSVSIIAQFLSGRKKIESWYFWIIADLLYVYIMSYQELYFHSLLFFIYLILAITGFLNWKKLRTNQS